MNVRKPVDYSTMYRELAAILAQNLPQMNEIHAIGKVILSHFTGTALSIVYSIFYNGLYMIPEIIITAIVAVPVSQIPQIKKMTVEPEKKQA